MLILNKKIIKNNPDFGQGFIFFITMWRKQ